MQDKSFPVMLKRFDQSASQGFFTKSSNKTIFDEAASDYSNPSRNSGPNFCFSYLDSTKYMNKKRRI